MRDEDGGTGQRRYFDKFLVLCRPVLLTRAARLLTDMLPDDCERLAAKSLPLAADTEAGVFGGELSAGTRFFELHIEPGAPAARRDHS